MSHIAHNNQDYNYSQYYANLYKSTFDNFLWLLILPALWIFQSI